MYQGTVSPSASQHHNPSLHHCLRPSKGAKDLPKMDCWWTFYFTAVNPQLAWLSFSVFCFCSPLSQALSPISYLFHFGVQLHQFLQLFFLLPSPAPVDSHPPTLHETVSFLTYSPLCSQIRCNFTHSRNIYQESTMCRAPFKCWVHLLEAEKCSYILNPTP